LLSQSDTEDGIFCFQEKLAWFKNLSASFKFQFGFVMFSTNDSTWSGLLGPKAGAQSETMAFHHFV
jgi:hypothetical protein